MARLPVIIPAYQAPEALARCLSHLRGQSHPGLEFYVRDNTHDNVYYTAAVNEGLARYCYDPSIRYVLVLNQDANLAPNAIAELAGFLERTPDCGIAAPLQLTAGGRVTWGGSLRAFPFGEHRCDPLESYTKPIETYWANGAAMMIRTEVVREVGVLDKNLRFICSDADFSFSARARGWKIHVVPAARCEHALSSSAGQHRPDLDLLKVRDALYFARKWVSGDLYRDLSFEGRSFTRIGVRQELERLERLLAQIEQQLKLNPAPSERHAPAASHREGSSASPT